MDDEATPGGPILHDPRRRGFRSRTSVEEWSRDRVAGRRSTRGRAAGGGGRTGAGEDGRVEPCPRSTGRRWTATPSGARRPSGPTPTRPAVFRVVGRSRPGRRFEGKVGPGEAVEIATGAPMPAGADAVVPVEATRVEARRRPRLRADPTRPARRRAGRGRRGGGRACFAPGRVLRPQDLGVLSALGIAAVPVIRRPRVTILVTGDELLPPVTPAREDRIADMNSVMLAALVARDGGLPPCSVRWPTTATHSRRPWPRPSRRPTPCSSPAAARPARRTTRRASWPSWASWPSTASPCGRPARTGLGFVAGVPVVLLPGNPVSCLCAYDLFAGPIVRRARRPAARLALPARRASARPRS